MIIQLENLSFCIRRTSLDVSGDIDILDEDVLEMLSGMVFQDVVKATLVKWEEEWSMVVWWDAPAEDWELLRNNAVISAVVYESRPKARL